MRATCRSAGGDIFATARYMTSLSEWERAEIRRSASEAARAPAPKATSAGVRRRYAEPPETTAFALEYALHLAGNLSGLRVLDLGCGSGENTSLLADRGAYVYAMDISAELLSLAGGRVTLDRSAGSVSLLRGSAHQIPLADQSVDLVFGNAVLHHLSLDTAAREIRRVLVPGGRGIFREPLRDSRTMGFLRRLIPHRQHDISPFERPLRFRDIELVASRFASWRHREFELPVVRLADIVNLPAASCDRLRAWDRRVLDDWATLRRFATLCVFEVRNAAPSK